MKNGLVWGIGVFMLSLILCTLVYQTSSGLGIVLVIIGTGVGIFLYRGDPAVTKQAIQYQQPPTLPTGAPFMPPPPIPISQPVTTQTSLYSSASILPAPKIQRVVQPDEIVVGRDSKTNDVITLPQVDRRRGLYVIGKNGTGKTTFLVNLMLQDIEQGLGLCFLDPHGDAIQDILSRLPATREKDVILLDVMDTKYPFGLNLYECSDPTDLELAARSCEQVLHIFEKLWGVESKNPSWGPAMEDLLRNIAVTFVQSQGLTLAEVPIVLTDEEARNKIVSKITNTQLRLFWNQFTKRKDKNEYMASTLNKVRAFLSNAIVEHIVGQSHTTIDLRKVMDEGKILLVKLPGRYEDITSLLGSVLIAQLLNAALSRVDTPSDKRRQFNLYVDEYQNFCTPDMATILAESRKFALASTMCHQFRDQLDQANRGATLNAANMVVFRISGEDGEELAKEFDCTPPPPEIIGQRPILSPKREVIEHLLKNGHSNPAYLQGAKALAAITEAAGLSIDRPEFRSTDNVLAIAMQYRTAKKYKDVVGLQTDLKVVIHRLNHFFYEVMRDRNAYKPFDQEDITVILKNFELYPVIKHAPELIPLLCSPDSAHIDQAMQQIWAMKREPQGKMIFDLVTSLRQLTHILAADPIMVDSGQHEPMYDKPRSYADVQNQIATDLANLPQYTARCKLGNTEVTVKTAPLVDGIEEELFSQRLQRIQAQTRQGYCKPRLEAEEEITTRQVDLIEPEEKKRRTKGEETV